MWFAGVHKEWHICGKDVPITKWTQDEQGEYQISAREMKFQNK